MQLVTIDGVLQMDLGAARKFDCLCTCCAVGDERYTTDTKVDFSVAGLGSLTLVGDPDPNEPAYSPPSMNGTAATMTGSTNGSCVCGVFFEGATSAAPPTETSSHGKAVFTPWGVTKTTYYSGNTTLAVTPVRQESRIVFRKQTYRLGLTSTASRPWQFHFTNIDGGNATISGNTTASHYTDIIALAAAADGAFPGVSAYWVNSSDATTEDDGMGGTIPAPDIHADHVLVVADTADWQFELTTANGNGTVSVLPGAFVGEYGGGTVEEYDTATVVLRSCGSYAPPYGSAQMIDIDLVGHAPGNVSLADLSAQITNAINTSPKTLFQKVYAVDMTDYVSVFSRFDNTPIDMSAYLTAGLRGASDGQGIVMSTLQENVVAVKQVDTLTIGPWGTGNVTIGANVTVSATGGNVTNSFSIITTSNTLASVMGQIVTGWTGAGVAPFNLIDATDFSGGSLGLATFRAQVAGHAFTLSTSVTGPGEPSGNWTITRTTTTPNVVAQAQVVQFSFIGPIEVGDEYNVWLYSGIFEQLNVAASTTGVNQTAIDFTNGWNAAGGNFTLATAVASGGNSTVTADTPGVGFTIAGPVVPYETTEAGGHITTRVQPIGIDIHTANVFGSPAYGPVEYSMTATANDPADFNHCGGTGNATITVTHGYTYPLFYPPEPIYADPVPIYDEEEPPNIIGYEDAVLIGYADPLPILDGGGNQTYATASATRTGNGTLTVVVYNDGCCLVTESMSFFPPLGPDTGPSGLMQVDAALDYCVTCDKKCSGCPTHYTMLVPFGPYYGVWDLVKTSVGYPTASERCYWRSTTGNVAIQMNGNHIRMGGYEVFGNTTFSGNTTFGGVANWILPYDVNQLWDGCPPEEGWQRVDTGTEQEPVVGIVGFTASGNMTGTWTYRIPVTTGGNATTGSISLHASDTTVLNALRAVNGPDGAWYTLGNGTLGATGNGTVTIGYRKYDGIGEVKLSDDSRGTGANHTLTIIAGNTSLTNVRNNILTAMQSAGGYFDRVSCFLVGGNITVEATEYGRPFHLHVLSLESDNSPAGNQTFSSSTITPTGFDVLQRDRILIGGTIDSNDQFLVWLEDPGTFTVGEVSYGELTFTLVRA